MIMSLKAQIKSLRMVMNKAYLTFINVTLYKEVISKFISPAVSQYVIVALARAGIVHSNKLIWEIIVTRRQFLRRQRQSAVKQKEDTLQKQLIQMQKSTEAQLEETVSGKIDATVPNTVSAILSTDLTPNAFKKSKDESLKKVHLFLIRMKTLLLIPKKLKRMLQMQKQAT